MVNTVVLYQPTLVVTERIFRFRLLSSIYATYLKPGTSLSLRLVNFAQTIGRYSSRTSERR